MLNLAHDVLGGAVSVQAPCLILKSGNNVRGGGGAVLDTRVDEEYVQMLEMQRKAVFFFIKLQSKAVFCSASLSPPSSFCSSPYSSAPSSH